MEAIRAQSNICLPSQSKAHVIAIVLSISSRGEPFCGTHIYYIIQKVSQLYKGLKAKNKGLGELYKEK